MKPGSIIINQTVTLKYSNMLGNELRSAIRTKRRGRLLEREVLLSDKVRPSSCSPSHSTFNNGIGKLSDAHLTPHTRRLLAPSDFDLLEPLKNVPSGRRFADDNEVKEAVHDWLRH